MPPLVHNREPLAPLPCSLVAGCHNIHTHAQTNTRLVFEIPSRPLMSFGMGSSALCSVSCVPVRRDGPHQVNQLQIKIQPNQDTPSPTVSLYRPLSSLLLPAGTSATARALMAGGHRSSLELCPCVQNHRGCGSAVRHLGSQRWPDTHLLLKKKEKVLGM